MKNLKTMRLLAFMVLAIPFSAPAVAGPDEEAVTTVLMTMFDKPDNHLHLGPIIIKAEHGIADWDQGPMGGRALLVKKDGKWTLRLCSGDGLKDAEKLANAGIDPAVAKQLSTDLVAAEAKIDSATLAKYASFQGTVVMDGSQ